jgi:hypothetical protein
MTEVGVDNSDIPSRPEFMLTTVDNPFDPFTQFDEWYVWDQEAGYCTPGLLARISFLSDDISEVDQHVALQNAIDEVVQINASGMHKKVRRGDVVTSSDVREAP